MREPIEGDSLSNCSKSMFIAGFLIFLSFARYAVKKAYPPSHFIDGSRSPIPIFLSNFKNLVLPAKILKASISLIELFLTLSYTIPKPLSKEISELKPGN